MDASSTPQHTKIAFHGNGRASIARKLKDRQTTSTIIQREILMGECVYKFMQSRAALRYVLAFARRPGPGARPLARAFFRSEALRRLRCCGRTRCHKRGSVSAWRHTLEPRNPEAKGKKQQQQWQWQHQQAGSAANAACSCIECFLLY